MKRLMSDFIQCTPRLLSLAEKFGSKEKRLRLCGRQKNRENIPSGTVKEYWQRSVYLPFLDVACAEMKFRFSQEMRAHYELCGLIPEVVVEHDDDKIYELNQCLTEMWSRIIPPPASFHGELIRWRSLWKRLQSESPSITNFLKQHADATFFPNIRELLKILSAIPVGSVGAEAETDSQLAP